MPRRHCRRGYAFLGWTFLQGVLAAAGVVLFYTWIGGFRATVYTEIFHFALVLLAVVPLLFLVAHELGGFGRVMARIPDNRLHAWKGVDLFAPHAVMDGGSGLDAHTPLWEPDGR